MLNRSVFTVRLQPFCCRVDHLKKRKKGSGRSLDFLDRRRPSTEYGFKFMEIKLACSPVLPA
jgi:hypothetical protein